ncbi:hypothetical protein Tco_1237789 [Tanacetum coccineum]
MPLFRRKRHVIETMAYNDKHKKITDEICKDKVELDGKTVKEDKEVVKRIKGEALNGVRKGGEERMGKKEEKGREDMKKVDSGITMIDHTQAKAIGKLSNVLCQVGVTTIIVKFLILNIPIDRDAPIVVGRGFLHTMVESDSDDEEEYVIKRNKFGAPIYGPRHALFLNCANPKDRSLAIKAVTNPFRKISVLKKAVSFFGSLLTMRTNDDEAGSSRSKRSRHETVEKVLLPQVHHEFFLWEGCNRDAKSRYNTRLAQLLPRYIYSPCIVNWDVLNQMGCDGEIDDMLRIRVREAKSEEEGAYNPPSYAQPQYGQYYQQYQPPQQQ